MKSIRSRLLLGLLLGSAACIAIAGYNLYRLVDHEADEQNDLQLKQVAAVLPDDFVARRNLPVIDDPDERLAIQVWDRQGRVLYRSADGVALPRLIHRGYATVEHDGERWRLYAEWRAGHAIQVAQPIAVRQHFARAMALRILPPLLCLLLALGVLIWIVVGQALRPVSRLAAAVQDRSARMLQPLPPEHEPPELRPIIAALNGLLGRIDAAMEAQRHFVADAAHELRSPLTALKLQLQLVERARAPQQRAEAAARLAERLDRATHLVQQLLTLARNEPSAARPPLLQCDLAMLARAVVADHAAHAESRSIDLGVVATPVPVLAAVHADGITVMLSNLIDNALRYTPPGSQVDVSAMLLDGRPTLRVADNGPGVRAAERARIFDRFYRPDGNDVWGSGLGMSIVRSVADRHGASIELADPPAGTGLVVTVVLPAD